MNVNVVGARLVPFNCVPKLFTVDAVTASATVTGPPRGFFLFAVPPPTGFPPRANEPEVDVGPG